MANGETCLRGLFDKDDDDVHPLVNNDIFKACPAGMRFETKEVRFFVCGTRNRTSTYKCGTTIILLLLYYYYCTVTLTAVCVIEHRRRESVALVSDGKVLY